MHAELRRLVGVILGVSLLVPLVLMAFAWPVSEMEPRSLPVAVAGPAPAAEKIGAQLASEAGEDAFEVTTVADRGAAVTALEEREAYAAVVASPSGPPEFLVATAASPAVAQVFTGIAASAGATVTDVAPPPAADPRGTTFGAGALPLVLGGLLAGIICSVALTRSWQRLAAGASIAALAGLALTWVLQEWLEVLSGELLVNAGVVALGLAAMAFTVVGLRQLLGHAGIGIAALLIMLVGNPLSGITTAAELLPYGWLGQLLPPGALGSALRSTAFFDGAGATVPLLVLGSWAVAGALLALLPARSAMPVERPQESSRELAGTP